MKKYSLFIAAFFWTLVSFAQITVSTFAGSGAQDYFDGLGTQASFFFPAGLLFDNSGNLYVADMYNHKIRKITPAGAVTTFAGTGNTGAVDGPGSIASFYYPHSLAIDTNGNLYVSELVNHKIRKITPLGEVSTFAGSGTAGSVNGSGSMASFSSPKGLAFDRAGNLYVADSSNKKIRKISPAGEVTNFADLSPIDVLEGVPFLSSFSTLSGLVFDSFGNLYASGEHNNKIRKITPAGVVSTFAGSGNGASVDGAGIAASFFLPSGLAIDLNDNIYVADKFNNKIRKITPAGEVTIYAGSGRSGNSDGLANVARFNHPGNVAFDKSGFMYVSDSNSTIRKIVNQNTALSNTNFDITSNIVIYPSLTANFVTIELKDLSNVKLSVTDITGKMFLNKNLNETANKIDLTALPAGIYLFITTATQGSAVSKVVKK
jgi:sugar lactone lactonase YvrE